MKQHKKVLKIDTVPVLGTSCVQGLQDINVFLLYNNSVGYVSRNKWLCCLCCCCSCCCLLVGRLCLCCCCCCLLLGHLCEHRVRMAFSRHKVWTAKYSQDVMVHVQVGPGQSDLMADSKDLQRKWNNLSRLCFYVMLNSKFAWIERFLLGVVGSDQVGPTCISMAFLLPETSCVSMGPFWSKSG